MAKTVETHKYRDDVAGLIRRIGALNNPMNMVISYNIKESAQALTRIRVEFYVDNEFMGENEEGVNRGEANGPGVDDAVS